LIGVAAAYGVALEVSRSAGALDQACRVLRNARPTAANLAWAIEQVRTAVLSAPDGVQAKAALEEAARIHAAEEHASAAMAEHGMAELAECRRALTHCNTGALAAPGRGTALAVIAALAERGPLERVLVCETRPLLQGARLTTYELARLGIDHELIVDGAAAGLIALGEVDAVIVGCDRVAANGDVANKVGTYALALAAGAAKIPFVVVGPTSSIDPRCERGDQIEIEERSGDEVRRAATAELATAATPCRNPAFDVTPAGLVTALVTERGVARPVNGETVGALLSG
jgi:methylthioribose-1-phosphate isomerase